MRSYLNHLDFFYLDINIFQKADAEYIKDHFNLIDFTVRALMS